MARAIAEFFGFLFIIGGAAIVGGAAISWIQRRG